MLKREEIARLKEKYPKGTPIRLYNMAGETSVPPGSKGIVDYVDDIGQIHMKWENGSCLALNVEEDRFDIITKQDEIAEIKQQEFIDKINEILEKTDFKLLNMSCNSENTSYAAEKLFAIREYTKPLFSIPTHAFLFNAGNIDARFYIDTLQLEKSEYNLIRYPQRGVCLYKCGNERYNLMVHAPEYKEKLFGNAGGR